MLQLIDFSGAQGFPAMVDKHAKSRFPSLHSPKWCEDDTGTTKGSSSESGSFISTLHRQDPERLQ